MGANPGGGPSGVVIAGWIGEMLSAYPDINLAYQFDDSVPTEVMGRGPTFTETGAVTNLTGVAGVSDFVTLYDGGGSYQEATMPAGIGSDFTVFFLYRAGTGTTQMMASVGNGVNDYFVLWITSGYLRARGFETFTRDTAVPLYTSNDGLWHLGCFRYNSSSDVASVFFNGHGPYEVIDFRTGQTTSNAWRFGDGIPASTGFQGSIAAMLWSSSVMSDADCAAITNYVAPPYRTWNNDPVLGLVGNLRSVWQFTEGVGVTALADSKNAYTLTTTGTPAMQQEPLFAANEPYSIAWTGANGASVASLSFYNYLTVGTYSFIVSVSVDDLTLTERVVMGNSIVAGEKGAALLIDETDVVLWHSDGTTRHEVRAVDAITDHQPHRIAVTAGGGTAQIYVDGVEVATGSIGSGASGSTNVFAIAQAVGGTNRFNGRIGPPVTTLVKITPEQVAADWEKVRYFRNVYPTDGASVLSLGDSLVEGLSSEDALGNAGGWRPSFFWKSARSGNPFQLVGTKTGGPYSPVDKHNGYGGQTILTINGLVPTAATTNPDIVVVMAGTNDIITAAGSATALTRYQTLMSNIQSTMPSAKVLACGIPFITGTYASSAVDFNNGLAAAVASYPNVVAFPDAFSGLTLVDGIHPNRASYITLGERISNKIQSLYDISFFSEILDSRNLSQASGESVDLWVGSKSSFNASQSVPAQQPIVEMIDGRKSVRFSAADSSFLNFDMPALVSIYGGSNFGPVTYITAFADTGLNSGSGRIWSHGSDSLNSTGLNLRQSVTGLKILAQDSDGVNTINNVYISNDGESQKSIAAIRINEDQTWDAWINGVQTVTASPISPTVNSYEGFNKFTIGTRTRFDGADIVNDLFDDCAIYGFGVILDPDKQSDSYVLSAIEFMKDAYGYTY